jgi:hypothetical protein
MEQPRLLFVTAHNNAIVSWHGLLKLPETPLLHNILLTSHLNKHKHTTTNICTH